jgi:multidrug efflux pump subunit AcrB
MATLIAVSIVCSSASAQENNNSVSLRNFIKLALQNNVDVQIANEAVEESWALRASAFGNFGPKVKIEGNVYMVMAAQFESVLDPFVVMFSVRDMQSVVGVGVPTRSELPDA